jgi:MFS family permease
VAVPEVSSIRMRSWEALRHRDFRLFWLGALVSNTGTWMQRVTVPYVLLSLTGRATWVGVATFAQFLPAVVLGPVGGSLADRYPRRTLLLVLQAAMAVPAVGLWLLWTTGRATPVTITAVVTLLGVLWALTGPAWQSFVSQLVPRPVLLNAVTLNSAQFNASRATGPALAGLVIAWVGPGAVFLINALSFAAVLAVLVAVRSGRVAESPAVGRSRPYGEFADALRYVRGQPGIVAALATVAALGLFGGPLTNLVVVFAQDVFVVSETAYGVLVSAFGVGAVLGAPLVAGRGSRVGRRRLLGMAVGTFGGAMVVFALAPTYTVALVALAVTGAGYLAIASTLNTTVQVQVDDALRGKVLSLYLMMLTLSMPVGALAQGWLTDVVGPRTTVAGAGVAFLAVVGLGVFGSGMADRLDDERVEAARWP